MSSFDSFIVGLLSPHLGKRKTPFADAPGMVHANVHLEASITHPPALITEATRKRGKLPIDETAAKATWPNNW
jgi:hypothetical protein